MSDQATLDTSALDDLDGINPEGESTDVTETPEPSATDRVTDAPAETAADGGPARDEHGRFAAKAAQEAAAKPADAAPIEPAAEAVTPTWEPFAIKVKGQDTPLEGVHFMKQDGHIVLATPEQNFNRVRDLMQRGRLYEEREQEFIARERSLREKESAPRAPSAEEIEAKVVLDYLKPHLPSLLNEADLQWLADKVKLANLEAQSGAQKATQDFAAKQQEESSLGQFREQQLAVWMDDLAKSADFAGKFTKPELEEFFDDLKPYAGQFLRELKPGAPLHERYGFENELLAKEFEKRVRRATLAKTTATKTAEATRFNTAQTGKTATATPRRVAAPAPTTPAKPKSGREAFDSAFKQWTKRSDLAFGDDDESE